MRKKKLFFKKVKCRNKSENKLTLKKVAKLARFLSRQFPSGKITQLSSLNKAYSLQAEVFSNYLSTGQTSLLVSKICLAHILIYSFKSFESRVKSKHQVNNAAHIPVSNPVLIIVNVQQRESFEYKYQGNTSENKQNCYSNIPYMGNKEDSKTINKK